MRQKTKWILGSMALMIGIGLAVAGCDNGSTTSVVPVPVAVESAKYVVLQASSGGMGTLSSFSNVYVSKLDQVDLAADNQSTANRAVTLSPGTVDGVATLTVTVNEPNHTLTITADGKDVWGNEYTVTWVGVSIDAGKHINYVSGSAALKATKTVKVGLSSGTIRSVTGSDSIGGLAVSQNWTSGNSFPLTLASGTASSSSAILSGIIVKGTDEVGNKQAATLYGAVNASGNWTGVYLYLNAPDPVALSDKWYIALPEGCAWKSDSTYNSSNLRLGDVTNNVTLSVSGSIITAAITGSGGSGTINLGVTYRGVEYQAVVTVPSGGISSGKWSGGTYGYSVPSLSNYAYLSAISTNTAYFVIGKDFSDLSVITSVVSSDPTKLDAVLVDGGKIKITAKAASVSGVTISVVGVDRYGNQQGYTNSGITTGTDSKISSVGSWSSGAYVERSVAE